MYGHIHIYPLMLLGDGVDGLRRGDGLARGLVDWRGTRVGWTSHARSRRHSRGRHGGHGCWPESASLSRRDVFVETLGDFWAYSLTVKLRAQAFWIVETRP